MAAGLGLPTMAKVPDAQLEGRGAQRTSFLHEVHGHHTFSLSTHRHPHISHLLLWEFQDTGSTTEFDEFFHFVDTLISKFHPPSH